MDLELNRDRDAAKELLLNELINSYGNELKRIAYLYVKDHSQCEDIIQEVFISCYKHLDTFRKESSYKTWLIRITINKCKDYQRRWSFRNIVYKPVIDQINQGKASSAESVLESRENTDLLIDALSKLPHKYKEVLILYYYQNMSMKEISDVTKMNMNTVKARLARGKRRLKESWMGGLNDE